MDQDCNGYDLTIDISSAWYVSRKDQLTIQATSRLNASAALNVDIPGVGTRSMKWNAKKVRWELTLNKASAAGLNSAAPGSVRVSGVEGEVSQVIEKR